MMLDVTAREGAARRATWTVGERRLPLPAVAHVHTPRRPAPGFATAVLARDEHPTLPTLLAQGSLFTLAEPAGGTTPIPRALVVPDGGGRELQEAADGLVPDGPVALAHDPAGLGEHSGLLVLPRARALAGNPWHLAAFLSEARTRAGPNAVLFAPGIGRPHEIALSAYAGVDLFDGLVPVLAGLQGAYLLPDGMLEVADVTEPPCACDVCRAAEGPLARSEAALHNQWAAEAEARRVRDAIVAGTLRELVEARAQAAPEGVATLRRLDEEHGALLAQGTPVLRTRGMPVLGRASLSRPEVRRWVERLGSHYTPPGEAKTLVVLPCSATKPYENSPTHRRIRPFLHRNGKGRVHIVTLTSPLGAVPEELEWAYPAAHYDIPVTGTWFEEERAVVSRTFEALATRGAYESVLLHLPPEEAVLVEEVFPKAEVTVHDDEPATDGNALARLEDALIEAVRPYEALARTGRFAGMMAARFDWQFGAGVGQAMMDGARIRGRYPLLRVVDQRDEQLALFQPERGALTLTSLGAERLVAATDAYNVEIDDFRPKGTVFAVGVREASPTILVEDEVLLVHAGELRAVGRALAPGAEMGRLERGPAVEVRHRVG